MSVMCPMCGFNLEADRPVEIGEWRISPREGVFWRNRLVIKRLTWTDILLVLAREQGKQIQSEALLARVSEGENANTLASSISQMRRHLEKQGVPFPIFSARGRRGGYRWDGGAA